MAVFSRLISFSTLAVYLSLFTALVQASPIDQVRRDFEGILAEKKEEILNKRADPARAVTGAQDGQTCVRPSLRTLSGNQDRWNLFLMSMENFKWMNQDAVLSYFDVASVHGVPARPWDGVNGQWDGNGAPGYCTHSSIDFPPWHRVYLALYEQAFLAAVQATINQFSGAERTRYQNAANCMRLPYWDWAQGPGKAATVVPDLLTNKMVTVPTPGGGSRQIINPIFRFDMHPLDPNAMALNPWAMWPTTLRYPTRNDTVNTYSQNNLFTSAIQNSAQQLKDQVYNIFTQCGDYTMMSNDAAPLSGGCSLSLEGVHNTIHNAIGGSNQGHMTYLWWSSFDPAFWIHHANVDRIFAMWQVIYPNSYIGQGNSGSGTYSRPVGSYIDGNTPLDPFHRTDGSSWTSNQVRDVNTFRYTYPELQQAGGNSQTMRNIVNQLYGNGGQVRRKRDIISNAVSGIVNTVVGGANLQGSETMSASASVETAADGTISWSSSSGMGFKAEGSTDGTAGSAPAANLVGTVQNFVASAIPKLSANLASLLTPTGRQHDYICNIAASRFGLGQSFNIYVFMGEPTVPAAQYAEDPALVGFQGVFSNPNMQAMNLTVTGAVPLTSALVAKIQSGAIKSLDNSDVGPYLRDNLKWKVVKVDGTEVPSDDADLGLKVGIVRSSVTPASNDGDFPTWHGFDTLSEVTDGMLGGLGLNQQWETWDKDC